MKLPFGLEIRKRQQSLQSLPSGSGGWFNVLNYRGQDASAFQQNTFEPPTTTSLLSFSAVFSCVTGIAGDIAKNRIKLDREIEGIWEEITDGSPFLRVLRKPNEYQNRIQFVEQWILSKLLWGNTYVALERDNRGGQGQGIVSAMYILDPMKVTPLISESGAVFYELKRDPLAGITATDITVPAEDVIHDRWNTLFHPLIGMPPLYACAAAAYLGSKIANDSATFHSNHAMPGGVISHPGRISDEAAARLKTNYEEAVSGANMGKVLILGDGLKFDAMRMTAQQAQTAELLKLSVEDVARAFHYPMYRLGGPMPAYAGNIQAVQMDYYNSALQVLIEAMEVCLDNGLMLPSGMGTEVDTDNLLRMDTAALYETLDKGKGFLKLDEQRRAANFKPLPSGGDTVYKQQQDYSIEALAKRDASPDPFATSKGKQAPPPESKPDPANADRSFEDLDFDEAGEELELGLTA